MVPTRAAAFLLAFAFAGCLHGGSPASHPTGRAPAGPGGVEVAETAAPARFDDKSGAIEGTVVDDDAFPIAGALVHQEARGATMARDGSFALSNVPPGRRTLVVEALGYLPASLVATVKAGESVRGVTVLLNPRTAAVPHEIQFPPQTGILTCGYAFEIGAGKDFCKVAFNGDHDVFTYPVADRGVVTGFVAELQWTPSLSPQFTRILGIRASDTSQWPGDHQAVLGTNGETGLRGWSVRGGSPLTYELRATNDTGLMWGRGGRGSINITVTTITSNYQEFAGNPSGSGPVLAFQQPVTMYATVFLYGARPAADYRPSK